MNNFKCPYCNHTQPFLKTFKIKPLLETNCSNCGRRIYPKFNKQIQSTWAYTFLLGIVLGVTPSMILLGQGYDIFRALLSGLFLGIIMIFLYTFIIYQTTKFEK